MAIVFDEVIAEAAETPGTPDRSETRERPGATVEDELRTFRRLQAVVQQRAARLAAD